MAKIEIKQRMRGFLMFLPNMVGLLGRLISDPRVPSTDKLLFGGAIVYAIIPFDFLPDMIPFLGQVDDIYLISLTLLRLINSSDEAIVREHWRGGGDIVMLAESIAGIAPMILPKRVRRVISSRIEMKGDLAGAVDAIKNARPLMIEIPEEVEAPAKVTRIKSQKRRA
ncbi:MAG: DUF1232 domain-containing protein [Pyrinomonadaceae bacterium]